MLQLPIKIDPETKLSFQAQIFEQFRRMILTGQLRAGDRLPPTRALSMQLGVSRITMTLAYDRLTLEGYIDAIKSVGTFVSKQIPENALHSVQTSAQTASESHRKKSHASPDFQGLRSQALVNPHSQRLIADFWIGRPDPHSFPIKKWARLINKRLLSAGSALTEYRDPAGYADLRAAIADHLRPARGIVASPEQILIVGGSQDALNLVSRMLVRRGTTAVFESPGYAGAVCLFETFGAKLHPIPVDEKGIDVGQLPNTAGSVAYVTPSHQYPTGVTLTLDRRIELLAWAIETNSYIVEDDYDSDFRFNGSPLAALKGLDEGDRVFYVGTFSKCLGAGLRLGYIVVPKDLVPAARHYKTLMNNGQPWLEQAALADFMNLGDYSRHLRHIRAHYMRKRDVLLAALEENFGRSPAIGIEGGMHFMWRIPDHLPDARTIEACGLNVGVGVYTLFSNSAVNFRSAFDPNRYLVFGFSSTSEKVIRRGIHLLAQSLGVGASYKSVSRPTLFARE